MTAEEMVVIVDRDDNVVDTAPRSRMRHQRLTHRTTYIFVFGSDGRLFVQKRTATKDLHPGYYDLAAGGVLVEGESYHESAAREAEEELGVRAVALQPQFKMYFEDGHSASWGWIYTCVHDGPFRLQPEEVESGEFMPVEGCARRPRPPGDPRQPRGPHRYLAREASRA